MKKSCLLAALSFIVSSLFCIGVARAQSTDIPKFELGAEFTSLSLEVAGDDRTEAGFGARFTYNLNRNIALEAAGYFFPRDCSNCINDGRLTQALFGGKVGKRFEKWGLFAKARPGLLSFSRGEFNIIPLAGPGPFPFELQVKRSTHFAFDAGAVLEFYASRRIVTRFDAGDTIVRYGRRTTNVFSFDPSDPFGVPQLIPFTTPARIQHNFQFSASVSFRF